MSKEIGVASTQRPIQAGIVNILAILIAVPARCTIRLTLPCAWASDTAGTKLAANEVVKMIGNPMSDVAIPVR